MYVCGVQFMRRGRPFGEDIKRKRDHRSVGHDYSPHWLLCTQFFSKYVDIIIIPPPGVSLQSVLGQRQVFPRGIVFSSKWGPAPCDVLRKSVMRGY